MPIWPPAETSHKKMSQAARQRIGATERLRRLSVGIEHPNDLLDDLFRTFGGYDEINKGQPPERAVPLYY